MTPAERERINASIPARVFQCHRLAHSLPVRLAENDLSQAAEIAHELEETLRGIIKDREACKS